MELAGADRWRLEIRWIEADEFCRKNRKQGFEVFVNQVQVYSAIETGALPRNIDVVAAVQKFVETGEIAKVPVPGQSLDGGDSESNCNVQ